MKLLMICHMMVPFHNAGGETTIHAAFRELVGRGHEVHVICRPHTTEIQFDDYEYEGVKVVRPPWNVEPYQWFKEYAGKYNPDMLLTHLDLTFLAEQLSVDTGLPLAHFVHNEIGASTNRQGPIGFHRVPPEHCQLAIHNSEWVANAFAYKQVPSVIVRPVVEPERYRCERGDKILFINPTPDKGADTFYALSKALPHREFLVVKSVYGEQIAPPNIDGRNFPNVEVMEHTADVREAFRKARVVLVPSIYESYGRVPVEAASAGIPAIAHPTEGLLEALGADENKASVDFARHSLELHRQYRKWETPDLFKGGWISGAGIFCDRNDIDSWASQIERLYTDELYYRTRSDAALELAENLDPEGEYDRLEEALISTIQRAEDIAGVKNVKMWTPPKPLYELSDGRVVYEDARGRIPRDAIRQLGLEPIREEVAIRNGLISDPNIQAKAIEAPAENKAFEGPQEIKRRGRRPKDEVTA